MNLKHLALRFLNVMAVVAVLLTCFSCDDTERTDSTSFIIYYSDLTDIGPSMNGVISSPTYKGASPYDFAITMITVNGESYAGDCFSIDSETGAISITNTTGAPVGLYKLSISCMANGKFYEYKDLVAVNMMKSVPDGITVTPNMLQVEYADIVDAASETVLPTAQVTTDGNHVSIAKYEIAASETSKFFAVSSTGEVSIVKGNQDITPGVYVVSLKLTTGASGEDEGIFENALTINVTSKPLELTYVPATGKIEEESELSGSTTFTSNAPGLKGSLEGLSYAIKSITPATDKIQIDTQTGVLSVAAGHGLIAGNKYLIDVTVVNDYAKEGIGFDGVFELEVVEFIEPVANFTYANVEEVQAVEFEATLDPAFKGDEVKFELIDLPASLQGQITVDVDGVIKAKKGNTIPLGTHTVQVKATNPKSDSANPTIATFTITITKNPNFFTYVRYGNNLGLTPAASYANQFRLATGAALTDLTPETDAEVELTYSVDKKHQVGNLSIDEATGVISITAPSSTQCGIAIVIATAGKGTKAEVSVKTPIFFHYAGGVVDNNNTSDRVEVLYTPFVMQVNPKNGGRSTVPAINGASDPSKIVMDYRRAFNYYNFNGTHTDGQPSVVGTFMRDLWGNYAASIGSNPNYGAKAPLSYFENTKSGASLANALAYVDADRSLVVNPNKWVHEGEYANGFFVGQITVSSNASIINNGGQSFPIVLWFDTNF